jgi:hypothetical protein
MTRARQTHLESVLKKSETCVDRNRAQWNHRVKIIMRIREATKVSINPPEYPTELSNTATQIYGGFSRLSQMLRGVKEGDGKSPPR